jgi:hypothetical protein
MDLICPQCGTEGSYSKDHDAYYCAECNEWAEDVCTERDCEFCRNRPTYPKGT